MELIFVNVIFTSIKKTYKIENGVTIKYSKKWIKTLNSLHSRDEKFINEINIEYGELIGNEINKFIKDNNSDIDFIASHGHTIFHQPEKNDSSNWRWSNNCKHN